jgi:hypothetical protein
MVLQKIFGVLFWLPFTLMNALHLQIDMLLSPNQLKRCKKPKPKKIDKNSHFVTRSIGKLSLCVKHKMPA